MKSSGMWKRIRMGTVVGIYKINPLSMVREFVPAGSIYKKRGEVIEKYEK